MDTAVTVAGIMGIVFLGLSLLVVWSRRDMPMVRGTSIVVAVLAAIAYTGAQVTMLGYAVPPIPHVTSPAEGEFDVLSVGLKEGVGIYMLVDMPDEPRLYWFPWSDEKASELQDSEDPIKLNFGKVDGKPAAKRGMLLNKLIPDTEFVVPPAITKEPENEDDVIRLEH